MARLTIFVLMMAGLLPVSAAAQEVSGDTVTVAVAPEWIDTGLIAWITPRFRFKTRVTIEAAPYAPSGAADPDLLIISAADAPETSAPRTPIASRDGAQYVAIALRDGEQGRNAKKLVSWLVSSAGSRAIQKFAPETGPAFGPPGDAAPAQTAAAATPQTDQGEKLALQHCGRCHVINEKNKYGGIGSTPSFGALRTIPNWRAKFDAFWTLNPHPSFTQIDGVTEPFPEERPPHIAPIELSLEEAAAIAAFAASMAPKDLGGEVKVE
ncbi:MAG: hypothetical protein KTR21_17665 [Rhodobacteraceae bacterium]|nr:hypothetical protein [Paracoccaceae bacterium]